VLADEAIQPALQAARQAEISRVDGEYQRVVEDSAVEPVRMMRSMPSALPCASARSVHSLIHEKRCMRRSVVWRSEVATVVDCSDRALPSIGDNRVRSCPAVK